MWIACWDDRLSQPDVVGSDETGPTESRPRRLRLESPAQESLELAEAFRDERGTLSVTSPGSAIRAGAVPKSEITRRWRSY